MPSSGVQTCALDRKSTRLNSSHTIISYAVFCLKKNTITPQTAAGPRPDLHHKRPHPPPRMCNETSREAKGGHPRAWGERGLDQASYFLMTRRPPDLPLSPYTSLAR